MWSIVSFYGGKFEGSGYGKKMTLNEDPLYYVNGKGSECTEVLLVKGAEPVKMSAADALGLVEGFLEGAVRAEGLDSLEACITDVEKVIPQAEKTFNDCRQSVLDSKMECVKDFATLGNEVKDTVKDCKSIADDIETLAEIVAVFSNPVSFAWHVGKDLLVNGINIYHDVENAIDAWHAQDWKSFGLNVGHATALVILGAETE